MSATMNRLNERFQSLQKEQRKALIPYISAGDPQPEKTPDIMHALAKGGADIIELGVAFSDPAADGEIIQLANQRALANGVGFEDVMRITAEFRQKDDATPIVLMGYLNSFERRGFANSVIAMKKAGVDAVILVDCPVEALPDYRKVLDEQQILPILLVAPTTVANRQAKIIEQADGFLYFVSLRGVTGKQKAIAKDIQEPVNRLKSQTDVPVCIGFGIRDAQTARDMAAFADGVVIGSALVDTLYQAHKNQDDVVDKAFEFIKPIREALDKS